MSGLNVTSDTKEELCLVVDQFCLCQILDCHESGKKTEAWDYRQGENGQ